MFCRTLVDNFGDPDCREWLRYGSKVPKDLYRKEILQDLSKDWSTCVVAFGRCEEIFVNAQKGQKFSYKFYAVSHDIVFGIYLLSDKKVVSWLEPKQVYGELVIVENSLEVETSGKLCLVFDNKSSWYTCKTVRYTFSID